MFKFLLPDIGEGVVEAEILEWKVAVGDRVEEDQVLVELMTDKAEIEVPSPRAGRVTALHFQPGDVAPVGAVLLEIDDGAASDPALPEPTPVREVTPAPAPTAHASPPASEAAHPPRLPERPRSQQRATQHAEPGPMPLAGDAVPAVRELARRLGVDLAGLTGSGPGGRIMKRDVEAAQAGHRTEPSPASPPALAVADEPDWEREPLRGLRRAIARRLVHARRTAAHFTYVDEVDASELLDRAATSGLGDVSPLAFIAHASVRALARWPILNSSIDDERQEIVHKRTVHLGIATATDEGLVVPVIRDTARLSLRELAAAIEDVARRAREHRLAPADMRGGTFTVSSLGKLGGLVSTPILNHPEVAILGVNKLREEPRVHDSRIVARRVLNLSLSVDHRIADGLVAARFIQDVREILEGTRFDELSAGRNPA